MKYRRTDFRQTIDIRSFFLYNNSVDIAKVEGVNLDQT